MEVEVEVGTKDEVDVEVVDAEVKVRVEDHGVRGAAAGEAQRAGSVRGRVGTPAHLGDGGGKDFGAGHVPILSPPAEGTLCSA
jgi:hypothetical protein